MRLTSKPLVRFAFPLLGLVLALLTPTPACAELVANVTHPLEVTLYNRATGEYVAFSGSLHVVLTQTLDGNRHFHYRLHFGHEGVSGIGLTSGLRYEAPFAQNFGFILDTDGAELLLHNRLSERYISQGSSDNFSFTYLLHLNVNAEGEITTSVSDFAID